MRIDAFALRQECDVDRSRHRQPRYAWAYMALLTECGALFLPYSINMAPLTGWDQE